MAKGSGAVRARARSYGLRLVKMGRGGEYNYAIRGGVGSFKTNMRARTLGEANRLIGSYANNRRAGFFTRERGGGLVDLYRRGPNGSGTLVGTFGGKRRADKYIFNPR